MSTPPRSAATVMLLRDAPDEGVEVFLVQRHPRSGFLGGAHVFPGGKVDEEDGSPANLERLRLPSNPLPEGPHGASARFAAIRETYEECGVLLYHSPDPSSDQSVGASELETLFNSAEIELAADKLTYVARWVTPKTEGRWRFDTHFYLAAAPPHQEAKHTPEETIDGGWFRPQAAIQAMHQRTIILAPPTLRHLELLSQAQNTQDAIETGQQAPKPVVCPELQHIDGKIAIVMPGDRRYGSDLMPPLIPGATFMVLNGDVWEYPDEPQHG